MLLRLLLALHYRGCPFTNGLYLVCYKGPDEVRRSIFVCNRKPGCCISPAQGHLYGRNKALDWHLQQSERDTHCV